MNQGQPLTAHVESSIHPSSHDSQQPNLCCWRSLAPDPDPWPLTPEPAKPVAHLHEAIESHAPKISSVTSSLIGQPCMYIPDACMSKVKGPSHPTRGSDSFSPAKEFEFLLSRCG